MNTFTRDPWHATELPHTASAAHDYWHIRGGKLEEDPRNGFCISGFMKRADAKLIAAAPNVIIALIKLVYWHAKRGPDADGYLPIEEQDQEIREAMLAIERAECELIRNEEDARS